jgi:FkbM family methyltransferase
MKKVNLLFLVIVCNSMSAMVEEKGKEPNSLLIDEKLWEKANELRKLRLQKSYEEAKAFFESLHLPEIKKDSADDGFFTVNRGNVVHKFAKSNTDWVNNFLKNEFTIWENDTFDTFEKIKDQKGIAIDLGAWIGTTAIWLSKNFAYVIAVEADKDSIPYLEKNLAASGCQNVLICDKAVADREKYVNFGPRLTMLHGDSLNGSTSFMKEISDSFTDYIVEAFSFQKIIHEYVHKNEMVNQYPISFIKCDIEGGEEFILEDILRFALVHNCKVWMSFHLLWWSQKKITEFADLFKKFKTNIETNDLCEFITTNNFASVLFEPL